MMWRYTIYLPAFLLCALIARSVHAKCTQSAVDACLAPMEQYDLENTATIVPSHDEPTMRAICDTYEGVRACMHPLQPYCHPQTRAVWIGIDQSYYYICDQTFEEYVRHQACLAQPSLHTQADATCNQTFHQQIDGISSHANNDDRVNLICRYVDSYIECIHRVVNAACGEEAANWQRQLDLRILGPHLGFIRCPLFEDFFDQWPAYVPTPSSSHSSANTAIICAAVAGALLVILIIAYMLARWQRRRKLDAEEREEAEMSHNHAPADLPPPFIVYEGGAAGAVIFPAPPPYKEKEALGDDYSSGVQPPMYEDVDPADTEKARMAARESSAENPYDGVANNGPVTGNSFDNASYDNVEFSSGSRN